jgi:hypothetical protein
MKKKKKLERDRERESRICLRRSPAGGAAGSVMGA